MITVDSPVETVLGDTTKGGGKRPRAEAFAKGLGVRTVGDLLRHHPRRYLETGRLTRLDDLHEGQHVVVVGEITHSRLAEYRDRRTGRMAYRLDTTVATEDVELRMSFFAKNQHMGQWHRSRLPEGARGIFLGTVSRFRSDWQLTHPSMALFGETGEESARLSIDSLGALYPIYPLTKGVDTWEVQRAVAFAMTVVDDLPELVPAAAREAHDVVDAGTALRWIHAPDQWSQVRRAQQRYRFEEALVTQVVLGRRRRAVAALGARPRTGGGGLLAAFDERLPFTLTDGQRQVGEEIEVDLARPQPMNRLLQGEVGSGKTLVALRAMLRVVDSGGQCALLAPTEVLAQQHHRSITALLGDLAGGGMLGAADASTAVELLIGSMTKTQRRGPLSRAASGEAGIVVGTHALLQEQVSFADLGLVVVDEQHRFGVEQRAALTDKAATPPHVLVMTATPIPRTVAMTVFGDLETSVLTELPAGRAPIQTTVVPLSDAPHWADRIWSRVREEVEKGHQVYVVCPRITGDEAEADGAAAPGELGDQPLEPPTGAAALAAVEELTARLVDHELAGLRVASLHGRMTGEDKDRTMRSFAAGEVDVLVATTVIEVGVDVANATTMVLLDADRFGVSQLHQLRGRVGRGGLPGLCLLVTHAEAGSPARERLEAVAATSDGFELSRVDLELRREGDVLGASQSGRRTGLVSLRVLRDEETILAARSAASDLLDADPDLAGEPDLAAAVAALEESSAADFLERG